MLPIQKKHNGLQVFQATEEKLFNEYFFKINNLKRKIGLRYIHYDQANQTLLTSNVNNGNVYIMNLITGKLDVLDNHKTTVRKVAVFGNEIITASWDNSIRVFNRQLLKPRLVLTTENMGRCPTFEVSNDYKWVYSFSYDSDKNMNKENIVRKWSLKTGRLLKEYKETGSHFALTRSGSLFIYKKELVVASDSGYLNFFDIKTGKLSKSNYLPRTIFRSTINVGDYAFLADLAGHLHKFSIKDQMFEAKVNYAHKSDVTNIKSFIKGGQYYIITTSFDGAVKIWSYPDLNLISEIVSPFGKWAMTIIGERTLIAGDLNGSLLIYDISNIKKIKARGVIRLFSGGSYLAYLDNNHGQTPIKQFYTNDLSLMDAYKGKPNEKDFQQLPWYLRPIVEVDNDPERSNEKITGKQAEYVLNACNNIDVLHKLFPGINKQLHMEIACKTVIPLLHGNVNGTNVQMKKALVV